MRIMNREFSFESVTIGHISGVVLAVGGLYTGLATLGVGVTFPWTVAVARADELTAKFDAQQQQITKQQQQLDAVIQQSQQQGCIAWQLLRDRYQADEKAAQDELNASPSSPTLQRARDDARAKVATMAAKLNAPPCT